MINSTHSKIQDIYIYIVIYIIVFIEGLDFGVFVHAYKKKLFLSVRVHKYTKMKGPNKTWHIISIITKNKPHAYHKTQFA